MASALAAPAAAATAGLDAAEAAAVGDAGVGAADEIGFSSPFPPFVTLFKNPFIFKLILNNNKLFQFR